MKAGVEHRVPLSARAIGNHRAHGRRSGAGILSFLASAAGGRSVIRSLAAALFRRRNSARIPVKRFAIGAARKRISRASLPKQALAHATGSTRRSKLIGAAMRWRSGAR